jgi:hypothetical protein
VATADVDQVLHLKVRLLIPILRACAVMAQAKKSIRLAQIDENLQVN